MERKENALVNIIKTSFDKLDKWYFDTDLGNLRHESGNFFSIDGIEVKTTWESVSEWRQPIINQAEVGYLGIITRVIDDVLYFLMQAKIEPGNIDHVQISPTLQATKSNYTRAHGGNGQIYLHYFQDRKSNLVLIDQLQSEQGARFLKKRNRNIVILTENEIVHDENYAWLTLAQIKRLMNHDNIVNMDTRTVISGIPIELKENTQGSWHTFDEILAWFTNAKQSEDLTVEKVPLESLREWTRTSDVIEHKDKKYFRVIPVEVNIGGREVQRWCQPMIEPLQEGLIAFLIKRINGRIHFLVQAKLECGNLDVMEMAPTVQCLTGNYQDSGDNDIEFLDNVLSAPKDKILINSLQSEEGGRFYREQNRNVIVEVDTDFPLEVPEKFIWMTLSQLSTFIKFNNYLNIQARSLVSLIDLQAFQTWEESR